MMIETNGVKLHVEQRGSGCPALVFLHYWGGSSRTWRHVLDGLASEFTIVAMDQRGWGRSDAPKTGYALADLANDALGLIEALDLRSYVLVGHSMGGKVAQLLAGRRPPGIVGLVLVAPSPPSPLGLPLEVRQGMVGAYDSRESILGTLAQVLAPHGLKSEDVEMVVEDSLRGAAQAKQAWPLQASQEDITDAATAIAVPTLVISGEDDRVDPPAVLKTELLLRIPQAELYVLPGTGHLSPLEAPHKVTALIHQFVAELSSRR